MTARETMGERLSRIQDRVDVDRGNLLEEVGFIGNAEHHRQLEPFGDVRRFERLLQQLREHLLNQGIASRTLGQATDLANQQLLQRVPPGKTVRVESRQVRQNRVRSIRFDAHRRAEAAQQADRRFV